MASTFKSAFLNNVGTTAQLVYQNALTEVQAVIFGLSATNVTNFPVTFTFYIQASRPSLANPKVTAVTSITQLTLDSVAGLAVGTLISPSIDAAGQQRITIIAGLVVTIGSTVGWGSIGVLNNSAIYTWSPTGKYNLLYNATLPVGGTLVSIGSDQKLAMQTYDALYAVASGPSCADVICSYLEIS